MSAVPAGSYVFMAKTTVVQTGVSGGAGGSGSSTIFTRCSLLGDPAAPNIADDYASTEVGRGDAWEVGRATLHTQTTQTLTAATDVTLRCRYGSNNNQAVVARETKIIAIQLDTITSRTAVGG